MMMILMEVCLSHQLRHQYWPHLTLCSNLYVHGVVKRLVLLTDNWISTNRDAINYLEYRGISRMGVISVKDVWKMYLAPHFSDGTSVKFWDANHFGLVKSYNMPCSVESGNESYGGESYASGSEDGTIRCE